MGGEISGKTFAPKVRKISSEAVRIKKKELGEHSKVYSKEVGKQISMVSRLGGEVSMGSWVYVTICSLKLWNGTGASISYYTGSITHRRARCTTDKAALIILADCEFKGIAYSLTFLTKVFLRSSLDQLCLHIMGSGISCSMSVVMCLYTGL